MLRMARVSLVLSWSLHACGGDVTEAVIPMGSSDATSGVTTTTTDEGSDGSTSTTRGSETTFDPTDDSSEGPTTTHVDTSTGSDGTGTGTDTDTGTGTGTGTDESSSTVGEPDCPDDLECDDALPCTSDTCELGECVFTPQDGVAAPSELQSEGDCAVLLCTAGEVVPTDDDDDLPVDGDACTDDVCVAGNPSNPPSSLGTDCGVGGVCDGAGACLECVVPSDCTALPPTSDCAVRTCTDGVCGQTFTAADVPVGDLLQTTGDCQRVVCDGSGGTDEVDDDLDVFDDGLECTEDTCDAGVPDTTPLAPGDICSAGVCDGDGGCLGCIDAGDCSGSNTDCQTIACEMGVCGVDNAPDGTPVPSDPQDMPCMMRECDGSGQVQVVPAAEGTDCEDDVFCNGADSCDGAGVCDHGPPPGCLLPQTCDEDSDMCV